MGCNRSVLFCSACCILLTHSCALGQHSQGVVKLQAALYGAAEPGQHPTSRPRIHNQLSTTGHAMEMQEQRIFRFLRSSTEVCVPGMSIRQVAKAAGRYVPVYLNEVEADLLGVDLDSKIEAVPEGTVFSQLITALETVEMTLHIQLGMLCITSRDAAEADPMIETFEVAEASSDHEYDFDSVMIQLRMHVDPDSWLMNGGCSSITLHEREDRWLLVISAPLSTQVKAAALLDRLLPLPRFSSRAAFVEPQSLPYYPHPPMFGSGAVSNGGFFRVVDSNKPRRTLGAGHDSVGSSSRSLPSPYRKLN